MKYSVPLDGFDGHTIEVLAGSLISGPKLFVDSQPAAKGAKRGEMVLHRNDGREVIARWKPQFMGFDVPLLVVDGEVVRLAEPLNTMARVWSGFPILLVFVGGAIGAVTGVVAFSINTTIFRSSMTGFAKYGLTAFVSLVAVAAWLIAAAALAPAVN